MALSLFPRYPFYWLIIFALVLCCCASCRTQVVEHSHSRSVSVVSDSSDVSSRRVSDSRRLSDVRRCYTEFVYDSVSVGSVPFHYRERLRERTDTVFLSDTLCIRDTLILRDTHLHTDTLLRCDTVYLTRPPSISRTTPEPTLGSVPRTGVGRFFARLGSALVVLFRALEACLALVGAARLLRLFLR